MGTQHILLNNQKETKSGSTSVPNLKVAARQNPKMGTEYGIFDALFYKGSDTG